MAYSSKAPTTWGKNLTDVEGVGFQSVFLGGDGNSNDPNDRHQRWGPADFDRTQRFVFTYLWEVPHPAGESFLDRKVLSGWTFSGVTTFQSGLPVTLTDSLGGSIFGSASTSRGELCPGFTPGQVVTGGGVESRLGNYFKPGCFGRHTFFTRRLRAACHRRRYRVREPWAGVIPGTASSQF